MTTAELNIFVRIRAAEAQRQLAQLRTQLAVLEAQTSRANASSNRPWFVGLSNAGSRLQWIGRQITTNLTAPIALATGFAIKWGLENERAMGQVAKVYGDGAQSAETLENELAALDRSFTALSNRFGVNKKEVIEVAAGWAAAGSSGVALAKQVELTMKTMVIGELDAAEATQDLIAIQAQYGLNTQGLVDTIEQLNAVENQSGSTMKGLIQGFARAAGVARTAGVDTAHLAAMIAALTPAAGSANEAGNALKTIMSRLIGPTGEARDVMQAMGINVEDASWQTLTATERMEHMAQAFEGLTGPQKSVASALIASRWQINKFEVMMREMASTTGYYAKSLDVLSDKQKVHEIAENELMTVLSTSASKVDQAGNIVKNAITDAFLPLIPVFVLVMQWFAKVATAFSNLDPNLRLTIIVVGLVAAALGPLIIMMGLMKLAIGQLAPMFIWLAKVALLPLAPFKLLVAAIAKSWAMMVLYSRVGVAAIASSFAQFRMMLAGFAAYQILMARIRLAAEAAFWLAFRGLAVAQMTLVMLAQGGWYPAMLALQRNYHAASLAVQRAFAAAYLTATIAWQAVLLKANLMYNAAWSRIAGAGYALQMTLHRAFTAASTALHVAWNSAMLTLNAGFWATWNALQWTMWRLQATIQSGFAAVQLAIQTTWNAASLAITRAYWTARMALETAGHGALVLIQRLGGAAMVAAQRAVAALLTINWAALWVRLVAITKAGTAGVLAAMKNGLKRLALFLISPIGLAVAAVVIILVAFKDQVIAAVRNVVAYFKNLPSGVAEGLAPIGRIFIAIRDLIIRAFNALPESVKNALRAVVDIVYKAAMKVYELFSYLNPFAHHSPSLVENVTEGMNVVGEQFEKGANRAEAAIANMYASMQKLNGAASGFMLTNQNAKEEETRGKIKEAGGGAALPEYDRLRADIKALKKELDAANAAVERQQGVVDSTQREIDQYDKSIKQMNKTLDTLKKVQDAASEAVDRAQAQYDRFSNAQISGTQAASDAVFKNEMAQKRLQLQIKKMTKELTNEAGGVDSVTDAYARLQGQIETLMGKQAELRSAGAGSDILNTYQDQIDALMAQQDALGGLSGPDTGIVSGPAAEVAALQTALEKLQDEAETMDLENALKFDPLNRELDKMKNKVEELPFMSIVAGLMTSEAQINITTGAYDAATAAVDAQNLAIEAAQEQRDLLGERLEAEQEMLDGLKGKYEEVETAISDGEQALTDFTTAAEETLQRIEEAARKAKDAASGGDEYISPGLQNFMDAANGDFPDPGGGFTIGREGGNGDQSAEIDAFTNDMASKVAEGLGGFDMFKPFKDGWQKVKDWWNASIAPMGQPFADLFGGIGAGISAAFSGEGTEKLSTFAQWISNIVQAFRTGWDYIAGFGAALGRLFGPDIKATIQEIANAFVGMYQKIQPQLKELWDTLGPALKNIFTVLAPVVAWVTGAIIGVIQIIWEMVNGAIGPAFNFIGTVIESLVGLINGVIQIISGFLDIVIGIFNIIKGVFTLDWETIKAGFSQLVEGIGNILGGLWDIVWAIMDSIVSLFKNMGQLVWNVVYGFVKGVIDFFMWLWDELVGHSIIPDTINAIVDWWLGLPGKILGFIWDMIVKIASFFGELPGKALEALGSLRQQLNDFLAGVWQNIVDSFPGWIQGVLDYLKRVPGMWRDALGDLGEIGKNLVQGFWEGIKSLGGWLKDKIVSWVSDHIPGPIKWALDINSPSGVTEELGVGVGEGLALGIDNSSGQVDGAVQRLSQQITSITLPAVPMNEVLKNFSESTEDASTRLKILQDGFANFRTEAYGPEDVIQSVNDTMRETPAALEGFNASMVLATGQIDTTSEAGSRVYDQIKSVQTAFDDAGASAFQSSLDQGVAAESAVQNAVNASTRIREQFVQQAIDSGLPTEAANRLADAYGLIPSDILTKLTADDQEARDAIQKFIDENQNHELRIKIRAQGEAIQSAIDQYGAGSKEAWIASGIMLPSNASGGLISGPGNGTDDKILGMDQLTGLPTSWVSNGEFVVNADSTKKYLAILQAINAGTFQALAGGGVVAGGAAEGASSDLAVAMSTIAAAVQAETDAVQAIWNTFVAEMLASYTQYGTDTGVAFTAIVTAVTTKHTEMYTAIALMTVTFKDGQVATFTAMSAAILLVLTTMHQQLIDAMTQLFTAMNELFTTSTTQLGDTWQALGDRMNATLTDSITPVFDAFGPLLQTLEDSFATTVDNVGTIWDGIKEKTAAPARFVINDVYNDGIRGSWNAFNDYLSLPPLPEHIAKFATGGKVFGAGTATSDSIPALLSNGEHVITAKEVRGAGGHAAIEATRRYWEAGKVGAFAAGGPVDMAAPPWPGGGGESNLQPAAILARRNIHKYWPSIGTIGGYRASDPYPDHPSGLALDVMTSTNVGTEVNDWLHREKNALALNYTIWRQMYKPAGGGASMMEDRGSPTQNHMDHVHALFNANGVPGIGVGGVGGGPTVDMGQVITDEINRRMDAVRDRAPDIAGGIGQWIPKSIDFGRKALLDKMVPLAKTVTQAMAQSGEIGNAESWRGMAMEAMRRNGFNADDPRQVDAMLRQIMSESSGNPRAVQQVIDVNSGGNEARGLLQIAAGTWPGARDPSLVDDIFDPWANMNAALRYYRGKYGDDLTTMWGQGHGYDQGGLLQPGTQLTWNKTGGPEPVLTQTQWDAMYGLAQTANTLETDDIKIAYVNAIEEVYGLDPVGEEADAIKASLAEWNKSWTPAIFGATDALVNETGKTTVAVEKTANALDNFTETGGKIQEAVNGVSKVMLAISSAMSAQEQTFAAWAPVLDAIADLIGMIPDQERDWAADNPVPGETEAERKAREARNNAVNTGKGLLQIFKDVAPILLKQTSKIGTAIESLIATQGPIISAALAMMPVNPIGGAIMLIPAILQGIFTILPLIIEAIVEIVPALIKAILKFLSQFMPDSVYAYEDLATAEAAVNTQLGGGAIAMGQGQRYPTSTSVQAPNTNAPLNINIYGDLTMPNVTNESGAQTFADQLVMIASNK